MLLSEEGMRPLNTLVSLLHAGGDVKLSASPSCCSPTHKRVDGGTIPHLREGGPVHNGIKLVTKV